MQVMERGECLKKIKRLILGSALQGEKRKLFSLIAEHHGKSKVIHGLIIFFLTGRNAVKGKWTLSHSVHCI